MTHAKTPAEQARARAAAATRAHHQQATHGRPSEHFDWDRALDGLRTMLDRLERKRA